MYLKILSGIIGILFILIGVAGFIPGLFMHGLLFGFFEVNTVHSLADIIIGLIALISVSTYYRARLFFQTFGAIFAVLIILSFLRKGDLYVTHFNAVDTYSFCVLAIVFLGLGLLTQAEERS